MITNAKLIGAVFLLLCGNVAGRYGYLCYIANIQLMVDSADIISSFVRNFIQKDKRERCLTQLTNDKSRQKFTDNLNHRWDNILNMKLLYELQENQHCFSQVQQILKIAGAEMCYIISNEKSDNTFLPFIDAFEKTNSASLGSLLMNQGANKLFLKTEDRRGCTPRFIGSIDAIF